MSVIVTRLGDAIPPGFADFADFFASWRDNFHPYRKDEVKNDYNSIVFGGTSPGDQLWIMDQPEFRLLHNLLPAGTTPVAAFCQIYSLKYREKLLMSEIYGLYTIKFTLWHQVSIGARGVNSSDWDYKLYGRDKGIIPVTIALPQP